MKNLVTLILLLLAGGAMAAPISLEDALFESEQSSYTFPSYAEGTPDVLYGDNESLQSAYLNLFGGIPQSETAEATFSFAYEVPFAYFDEEGSTIDIKHRTMLYGYWDGVLVAKVVIGPAYFENFLTGEGNQVLAQLQPAYFDAIFEGVTYANFFAEEEEPAEVTEPSTLLLILAALAAMFVFYKRRAA